MTITLSSARHSYPCQFRSDAWDGQLDIGRLPPKI